MNTLNTLKYSDYISWKRRIKKNEHRCWIKNIYLRQQNTNLGLAFYICGINNVEKYIRTTHKKIVEISLSIRFDLKFRQFWILSEYCGFFWLDADLTRSSSRTCCFAVQLLNVQPEKLLHENTLKNVQNN